MLISTLQIHALHHVKFLGAGSAVLLAAVYFGWLLCCAPWFYAVAGNARSLGNAMDFRTLIMKDVVTAKPSGVATGMFLKAPLREHVPSFPERPFT